jgi:N-dimethylarginine dimethylaminohydrolase
MTITNIYMCDPSAFEIEYVINPWMEKGMNAYVDIEKAKFQWMELKDQLASVGANLTIIPSQKYPDLVFVADSGLALKNKFILSSFRHPERQYEEEYWQNFFSTKGFETIKLTQGFFEGTGDAIFHQNALFIGYGQRSSLDAIKEIEWILNMPVTALELVDPRFYHLDTCFAPLKDHSALVYKEAFSEEAKDLLQQRFDIFEVPEEEACNFACNIVPIENKIVMQKNNPRTKAYLESLDYEVRTVDVSEFMKAGGSSKCLTLKVLT